MNRIKYTHLEIKIPNVLHNLNYFRSHLPSSTKILVVAKAFAYGHGSGAFAKILEANGVDYLAVAFPSEGVALREAGVKLPIIALSACDDTFSNCIEYGLEPSIHSLESFHHFVELVKSMRITNIPAHLKIDSGMHRLGFEKEDIPDLLQEIDQPYVTIKSVFSHLACSEDPTCDSFTHNQIAYYKDVCAMIFSALPYRPIQHLLNSAGIERFGQEEAFDMVRLGIGLYGVSAVNDAMVEHTAILRAPVLQVKTRHRGDTIGYDRKGVVTAETAQIATVAIGYADGVDRLFGNGNIQFMLDGHLVPTIGNICMDTCMVDVTGMNVKAGDLVTIFGEEPTISSLAERIHTIPYEVLSSVNTRVPRIYTY